MTCRCHSGKAYEECCQPYHMGKRVAPNALELMRSRYSAYANNLPDYIIATTHPKNPSYKKHKLQWIKDISDFATHTDFKNLDIVDFKEQGSQATVTFRAILKQGDKDVSFEERSLFQKDKGHWYYVEALSWAKMD